VPGRATAVAFVAYEPSGGRDFWFSVHDSAAMAVDRGALERVAPGCDWVHVSGSTLGFGGALAGAAEEAAARVLRAGGRLSLDPNLRPDASAEARARTGELARAAHVLFPSEGELEAIGVDAGEVAAAGALVCRTRGPEGALVEGEGAGPEPVPVPAPRVEEVDPTGAGDTFAAAWVAATLAGAEPVAAARVAVDVAARAVRVLGAMQLELEPLGRDVA
jgi:sugar/nucleoside kinase (ribokinase family)